MSMLKPYDGPTKLVVAFDIGTTFSGIAYCLLDQGQLPWVFGVTRFPAQGQGSGDAKVPSLLYYDKNGNVRAAGAEVNDESVIETALTEGWTKAEWWKLHLRPKHLASSINRDNDLPPLPSGKSADDILTDFIKYLFECFKIHIHEHHPAVSWSSVEHSIEFIFTHPNGWEGAQQRKYRRAIARAGLVPGTREGQSRVRMLTDGEASLHFFVANNLNAERTTDQAAPQGVVIIDAGGGTIDSNMFSTESNPISCEEIAPPECRLQGSVFVTRRAKALLERKLEGWKHSSPDDIAEFTREFDKTTKLVIKSDKEKAYIRVGERRTNSKEYNIAFGKLKLMGEEATGLFTESIDAIIGAFEQQQKSATTPITMAFLVGGLSTNDWLWSQLQAYFEDKNINICRPDNDINKAVAYGAVLSHVDYDNHLVELRACVSYGVICSVPVQKNNEEHIRRRHLWESDPRGNLYVRGCFKSTFRKGARLPEEMEFQYPFSLTESDPTDFGMQVVSLVCYRGSLPDPEWVDQDPSSFSTLCIIRVDLSGAVQDLHKKNAFDQVSYQLDYDVIVFFGFTEIQAYLSWKTKHGERRVPARVLNEEDMEDIRPGDRTQFQVNQCRIPIKETCPGTSSPQSSAALFTMHNHGNSDFLGRFAPAGKPNDLEQAILKLQEAVNLTPHGYPNKHRHLNNLGNSYLTRFEWLGELSDLELALSMHSRAIDLILDGHPDRRICLGNLAYCFLTRFKHLAELGDLEQAISRLREVVDLTPDGHPEKRTGLNNLADSFLTRFKHLSKLGDLGQAISRLRKVVDVTPDGHPDKHTCLGNLANSLLTRFKHLGELGDLEQAISRLREAIDLIPDGHSEALTYSSNLGMAFFARFGRLGEPSDLEETMSRLREAVGLTPGGHPDAPAHLSNLGKVLFARFERLGELSDLEEAMLRLREAVGLTPDGHPDAPAHLSNLGKAFFARFECLGEPSDLEDAMTRLREPRLSPGEPEQAI